MAAADGARRMAQRAAEPVPEPQELIVPALSWDRDERPQAPPTLCVCGRAADAVLRGGADLLGGRSSTDMAGSGHGPGAFPVPGNPAPLLPAVAHAEAPPHPPPAAVGACRSGK